MGRIMPAGWQDRLRAARRILFGRGDDAVACSFCGRDRLQTTTIICGPGVAICGACAAMALEFAGEQGLAETPPGMAAVGLMLIEVPACLLPQRRATLAADLAAAAAPAQCRLLGWAYRCNIRAGDLLSVHVAIAPETSGEAVAARLSAAMLGAAGPGGRPGPPHPAFGAAGT